MSEISNSLKKCAVVNDKLQDSTVAHLGCNCLFNSHFTTNFIILFTGENVFKIGEQLEVIGKMFDCLICPVHLALLA